MFKKVYIEITNNCNLNCSFCTFSSRPKKFITLSNFKHIIQEIKPFTSYVYLHILGEPLLHPKLEKILEICQQYSIKVNITTNGTLLPKSVEILQKYPPNQLNISLHSENNLPNYEESIFNSVIKLSPKTVIIYRLWTLKNGQFDQKSTKIVQKIISTYNLSPIIVNKIKNDKNIKIASNIYLDKDNEFVWPSLANENYGNNGTCYGLRTHVGILVDGTVIPCCLDSDGINNLGNIYETPFADIIKTPLALAIKNNFQNNKVICKLCQKCAYKNRF